MKKTLSIAVLAAAEQSLRFDRDRLLAILQLLSMSVIATAKKSVQPWVIAEQLEKAETLLLNYLKEGEP